MGSGVAWVSSASEAQVKQIIPTGGTLGKLHVKVSTAPGAGCSWTFCLMKNSSADTGTNCVISGSSATSATGSGTISVTAGDFVSIRCTTSGTAATSYASWYLEWIPTTSDENIYMGTINDALNAAATEYSTLYGGTTWSANSGYMHLMTPMDGTWKNLYVNIDATPGGSGSYAFTLMDSGSASSTTLTFSSAESGTKSDIVNTRATTAGDFMCLRCVGTSASNTPTAKWGIVFTSSLSNYYIIGHAIVDVLNTTTDEYGAIVGCGGSYSTTESSNQCVFPACDVKNLYARANGATGGVYDVYFRDDSSSTTLVATGLASTTVVSDTTHTVSVVVDSLCAILLDNTTTASSAQQVSYSLAATYTGGYTTYTKTYTLDSVLTNQRIYVDNASSNVDSSANVGTHSDFSNQQTAPDSTYDTLTEDDADTGTNQTGDTSGSGTSYRTTAANEVRMQSVSAGATGEVASIVFYGRGSSTTNCKAIITDSSGNLLTNGVGEAVSVSTTAGTKTLTFAAGSRPLVVSGTTYWIGMIWQAAGRVYYDSTTGGTSKQDTTNSYTTPTSPTDAGSTTETWRLMYANINKINGRLDLEEQFVKVPYSSYNKYYLKVVTGTLASESLKVDIRYSSGWTNVSSGLTASTTNSIDITSYVTEGTVTIRFTDGTTTDDNTLSTWQIDSCYIECVRQFTKTFSVDAVLLAGASTKTKTYTVDSVLKKLSIAKTYTVDTRLLYRKTKTYTVDTRLLYRKTKTYTVDACLRYVKTKTYTVNAHLVSRRTKTYTVDASLKYVKTKTYTVDAALKYVKTKTYAVDAVLKKLSLTKTYTIDARLKYVKTKTYTADAVLKKLSITKSYTVDATLKYVKSKTYTADAVLKKTSLTKTYTVDARLYYRKTKTFTVDSSLKYIKSKTYTVDASLKYVKSKTFTVDAVVLQSGTYQKTYTIDAVLKRLSATKTYMVDASLKYVKVKTYTVDAALLYRRSKTFTVDAVVLLSSTYGTKTYTIDSVLMRVGATKTFTVDVVTYSASVPSTPTPSGGGGGGGIYVRPKRMVKPPIPPEFFKLVATWLEAKS